MQLIRDVVQIVGCYARLYGSHGIIGCYARVYGCHGIVGCYVRVYGCHGILGGRMAVSVSVIFSMWLISKW